MVSDRDLRFSLFLMKIVFAELEEQDLNADDDSGSEDSYYTSSDEDQDMEGDSEDEEEEDDSEDQDEADDSVDKVPEDIVIQEVAPSQEDKEKMKGKRLSTSNFAIDCNCILIHLQKNSARLENLS